MKVFHFHNGSGGGVLSVIRNLLLYKQHQDIENHVIYTINKNQVDKFEVPQLVGAASEQFFYYSSKWNFYYTCRQLAKLLPDNKAIIVAHDWLELGMVSNLGLQNPVVFFLHGDYKYYYELAQKHDKSIDFFIPVAQSIELNLKKLLRQRINDIYYLRFPVPSVTFSKKEPDGDLVFIGRLEKAKGYPLLSLIAKKIKEKSIEVQWHIIGSKKTTISDDIRWDKNIQVKFYGEISNAELFGILAKMKLLILPSLAEGMPVVLIEAMKAGVIPVVNDIEGGIQELVIENQTGYKIKDNQVDDYVNKIVMLLRDKKLTAALRYNVITTANNLFDPIKNTKLIEDKLNAMLTRARQNKHVFKTYGSRLDIPWIPNWVVYILRRGLF